MGIPLNHPIEGSVGWASTIDSNWKTLETTYVARQKSDTSVVTVSGTTSETLLMNHTTIPANALAAGTVIPVWAAGNLSIAATTTPTFTFNLRWGGLAGVLIWSNSYIATSGAARTIEWVFDNRICCESAGASGVVDVEAWALYSDIGVTTGLGGTSTIDTTTSKSLVWTVQMTLTSASAAQRQMITDQG